jgi:hypothetical protein
MAIQEIESNYDRENISQVIHSVLKEFNIVDKFEHFMGNNASNNDTALEWLNHRICRKEGNHFDVPDWQLCCFAHDMQIAIKGMLFGPKIKELETYQATSSVIEAEKAEWMKKRKHLEQLESSTILLSTFKFLRNIEQDSKHYCKTWKRSR